VQVLYDVAENNGEWEEHIVFAPMTFEKVSHHNPVHSRPAHLAMEKTTTDPALSQLTPIFPVRGRRCINADSVSDALASPGIGMP
jgi:hypothetical protein